MTPAGSGVLQLLGLAGIAIGTVGLVVPILPGPALIWVGAAAFAWGDGFVHVGWPTLILLGLMAIAGEVADLAITSWGARRSGVPIRSLLASAAGSLIGAVFGSLPGALLGAVGGLGLAEWIRLNGDWSSVIASSRGVIAGYLVAIVIQAAIGIAMLGLFLWHALPAF